MTRLPRDTRIAITITILLLLLLGLVAWCGHDSWREFPDNLTEGYR
jgi:hypothetical protein